MDSQSFFENVVIITGASSGIGRGLALQLARQGAWLVLAARNVEKLEEVANLCQKENCQAMVVPTDVSQHDQCQELITKTVAKYGRIDTLVNNAGLAMYSRFDELQDTSIIEQLMRVNFFASVYTVSFALPFLKQTKGRLVAVSSQAGKYPTPLVSGYCASKHALTGLYDTLRIELRNSGVSVTMIYFGFVRTGMGSRSLGPDGKEVGDIFEYGRDSITVEKGAEIIIDAAWQRKRQYIPLSGKIGLWLKEPFPAIIDQIAIKTLEGGPQ